MAKKVYFGVDGKARKVKKIYVGVDGKARKVKKGYVGVGGKARPFWTGGEIAYYGTVTGLTTGTSGPLAYGPACSFADKKTAFFDGYNTVFAVNSALTTTKLSDPEGTATGYYNAEVAPVGSYVVRAYGKNTSTASVVRRFNTSLSNTTLTSTATKTGDFASATNGTYAVFSHGSRSNISAYNSSGTLSSITHASTYQGANMSGMELNAHAFFIGGENNKAFSVSQSLTVTDIDSGYRQNQGSGRVPAQAASTSKYGVVLAGWQNIGFTNKGVSFLVRDTSFTDLSFATTVSPSGLTTTWGLYGSGSVSMDDQFLFVNGFQVDSDGTSKAVTWAGVMDDSLTFKLTTSPTNSQNQKLRGAVAGNYALFPTKSDTLVEAYTIG